MERDISPSCPCQGQRTHQREELTDVLGNKLATARVAQTPDANPSAQPAIFRVRLTSSTS